MTRRIAPFGTWSSPITPERAAKGARRYSDLTGFGDRIFWCEGRPEEGGRNVIVMAPAAGGAPIDLLPEGFSARSKVHEYGGGAFLVAKAGLFFVNADDQDIYHLATDGAAAPRRITSRPDMRFADGCHDPLRNRLIMVAEQRPEPGDPHRVDNLLVAVSLGSENLGQVETLRAGRDFYAAPRLDAEAMKLAWLEWSLPAMPWEASELWLAALGKDGRPQEPARMAGGDDAMAGEPQWDEDGSLWFIGDDSGWASLHRLDANGAVTTLPLDGHEFGQPMWGLGQKSYLIAPGGAVLAAAHCAGELRLLSHDGRQWSREVSEARQIAGLGAAGGRCFAVAATDYAPAAIIELNSDKPVSAATPRLDKGDISVPRPVSFEAAGGATAHALYYPPCNSRRTGPPGSAPPMIVSAHGGPTGMADRGLKLKIQYWTSRGFAWLDVDYRGSTGHGRDYRRALDGYWGLSDVEDVAAGALHMAETGLADPDRLLISGSSAGGYTVLRALCETDIFAAGASTYGIGDLKKLLDLTHKFESGYLHGLLGLTPENREQILRRRSPLHHAEDISCPVIFLQGAEDFVVPPDQSRDMAASLRARGTPVSYVEFAGEGHGFRRSDTIIAALMSEYAFYAAILGLSPEEELPAIAIDNFPPPA